MMMAVPMGAGVIDYRTFFATLQQTGFPGVAAYEMCSPIRGGGALQNLERYARAFVDYMGRRKSSTTSRTGKSRATDNGAFAGRRAIAQ